MISNISEKACQGRISVKCLQGKHPLSAWLARQPVHVRSLIYSGVALSILVFGEFVNKQLIYFQF